MVCAHALQRAGVEVLVVEASGRPGGAIRSRRCDGYLLELGPQSFSSTEPLLELIAELGIESEMVQAPPKAARFVLVGGVLRQVPLSPPAFLASGLVGLKTKWAIARDLFGRGRPPASDESIGAFVRRKFSADLLDRLVGPFVSGVYAGDPERLSLRSSFPLLYEAERNKGSVIRGLWSDSGKQPRQRPTLLSFREGAETLIYSMARLLGRQLRLDFTVTRLRPDSPGARGQFQVTTRTFDREETLLADYVILATPTDVAGKLLRELDPGFEQSLGGIEYAPIAVVSLAYPRCDVGHDLSGFGFLVPRSAGLRVLGSVWNSSLFPGRAPDGHTLFTSFVGGATDPQATSLSDAELTRVVHKEIAPLLQIRQNPDFSNVTIYPRALPQYNLGHAERLTAVERQRSKFPNLRLAGNYLRGPSIGACVAQSLSVAQEILSRMRG